MGLWTNGLTFPHRDKRREEWPRKGDIPWEGNTGLERESCNIFLHSGQKKTDNGKNKLPVTGRRAGNEIFLEIKKKA